jgi:hypothetical protein
VPSQPAWPLTLLLVVLAGLLSAWNLYGALILTAPFFGDAPSRDQYVEAAAVALTGLLPVVLLAAVGRMLGSGMGLLVLALPAIALVALAFECLSAEGDPSEPDVGRAASVSDLFADTTALNWMATGVLVAVALVVRLRSNHRRRTSDNRAPAR